MESKCWKKNPNLIPDKVKAAPKKQAEKKAEKATAAIDEEMIPSVQEFDMNDTFTSVTSNKSIVFLKDAFEDNDEESDDDETEGGKFDVNNEGCKETFKDWDSDDDKLPVAVIEPNKDGTYDLDLSLSVVANVISDTDFTTGAHVLDSQNIWIADTGATSHVTKHKEAGQKHC